MTFPIYIELAGRKIHPHLFFDILAYSGSARLYFYLRKKAALPTLPVEKTAVLFIGVIFGALLGAKILAWLESPHFYWALRHQSDFWMGGKTIVGAILGGWAGAEIAKKLMGSSQSTGDLFVFSLLMGIAIGRIGCFLTGLQDQTYGIPTTLPWGINFGDGIFRHPTQLYESIFIICLGLFLFWKKNSLTVSGSLFRYFLIGYLSFRFLIEFLKPHIERPFGLTAIQWACLLGIGIAGRWLIKNPHTLCQTDPTSSTN